VTGEAVDNVTDYYAAEPLVFSAQDHVAGVEDGSDGVDVVILKC
jgi:hypothetical protein